MSEEPKIRGFCPLMKETCVNGHTESMGTDADGFPVKCKFWVRMSGQDSQGNKFDKEDCLYIFDIVLRAREKQEFLQFGSMLESLRNRVADVAGELSKISNHAIVLAAPEALKRAEMLPSPDPKLLENKDGHP